jgi:hypothetical protein
VVLNGTVDETETIVCARFDHAGTRGKRGAKGLCWRREQRFEEQPAKMGNVIESQNVT